MNDIGPGSRLDAGEGRGIAGSGGGGRFTLASGTSRRRLMGTDGGDEDLIHEVTDLGEEPGGPASGESLLLDHAHHGLDNREAEIEKGLHRLASGETGHGAGATVVLADLLALPE